MGFARAQPILRGYTLHLDPYAINASCLDSLGGWLADRLDLARFIAKIERSILKANTVSAMTTPSGDQSALRTRVVSSWSQPTAPREFAWNVGCDGGHAERLWLGGTRQFPG
jgi:hypothetical protein